MAAHFTRRPFDSVRAIIALSGAMFVLATFLSPARAVEKWADKALPVTDGLELWLDASRVAVASKAHSLAPPIQGGPLETWFDGSGHHRDVTQSEPAARPRLAATKDPQADPSEVPPPGSDASSTVQFVGGSQYLAWSGDTLKWRDTMIFVVGTVFSNSGGFRGLVALGPKDQNDYVAGLNLDFGPFPTQRIEWINTEGAGFGGAVDLLDETRDFGTLAQFTLISQPGKLGTQLLLDGRAQQARARDDVPLSIERAVIGARHYQHGGPPIAQGFLRGAIAEVLIYDRALTDVQRQQVESYLAKKHKLGRRVEPLEAPAGSRPLVAVPDASVVQMLVPGFEVRELPIDLPNINNLRYRHDGKLVALAYSGDVYLLDDSDGDGREDRAALFWENRGRLRDPIGMALTPPGYARGSGLFVPAKGKCSLIVDTDADDVADEEIVVATGWPESPHGVDAIGAAFDTRDGSLYFGLGAASYTGAYLIDAEGKSQYRLDDERGTVMRVAPDFKRREIICTGVRFSVALAFNAAGDLFCTDQEGATWLANGNPFDELLHLERDRHYGFPPRHPRHLPAVIDEPSVYDYTPQHQSTCGLTFNERRLGPAFGPAAWHGDALVCGYSRGKLYRTQLQKTTAGYVADTQTIAQLGMLACDACVSPHGDLIVCAHSGGPDWGSGPVGRGKLFQIRYAAGIAPQPVAVWCASPREVRVAFDRPLSVEELRAVADKPLIEYGRYVAAADRFERLRPGYQVVQDQLEAPRYELPVHSVQAMPDRQTLILETALHEQAATYAVTLNRLPDAPANAPGDDGRIAQLPQIDLTYRLAGVEVSWESERGLGAGCLVVPHVDLKVSREFLSGSDDHFPLWDACQLPGRIVLRTRLDLTDLLRPAVQPGATIDYTWPDEVAHLELKSSAAIAARIGDVVFEPASDSADANSLVATVPVKRGEAPHLEIELRTPIDPGDLTFTWHTDEDPRPRAFPLRRFALPWAPRPTDRDSTPQASGPREIAELRGGNWSRGKRLFHSEQAQCGKCHRVHGEGGPIGPDLSNLPHRDYASVLRDVKQPSYAIHPDYVAHNVVLDDGHVLVGTLRSDGDKTLISDNKGEIVTVATAEIELIEAVAQSTMPEGLADRLGPDALRDLLTYLLTPLPRLADYGPQPPPLARSRAELAKVLAGAQPVDASKSLNVVLVAGPKDHGPGEHDYPAWQQGWSWLLALAENVEVETAFDWPSAEQLAGADLVVFYQRGDWNAERAAAIDKLLSRGGGLVFIHYAVDGGHDPAGLAQRIGLAWDGTRAKFRHGPLDVQFRKTNQHPIARNFERVSFVDESYWQLSGDARRIGLLGTGREDDAEQPLFWTHEVGRGRVFVSIPGHFSWTFDDPLFRLLLLRGVAWTAGEPVDRFNDLAGAGARVVD